MIRILLIDDDELLRVTLKDILERAGYQVVDASDGNLGNKLYREDLFDLIITDIFMPNQDGITTISNLKKINPQVKIIAISGGGKILKSSEYLMHAKLLGALKTIQKPIDPKELLQTIKELTE